MDWTYHDPVFEDAPDPAASWIGHRRFGYDLVRNLRPRRLGELGVCAGTSFFAFCQAVKDGGLDTELVAVDTWEGDEHTGRYGPGYLEQFDLVWRTSFAGLTVRQIKRPFDDARAEVADASLDLLHLDGCHTYDAARHDYETWAETVRPDGIILFHDIAVRDDGRGFGVYRLWDELKASHATAEFRHSFGLGVLFKAPPADLPRLREEWRRRYER